MILLLIALITLIACSDEDKSEVQNETNRVDTVNKLLSKTQIENYVLKYSDEIGLDKATEQIDSLIEKGDSEYTPDIGERTGEELEIEYTFIKPDNHHYIKIKVTYVVTFTHSRFNGVTHLVIHRPIEYDIGEVYIKLDVDYNDEGYLLKGRKITTDVE